MSNTIFCLRIILGGGVGLFFMLIMAVLVNPYDGVAGIPFNPRLLRHLAALLFVFVVMLALTYA